MFAYTYTHAHMHSKRKVELPAAARRTAVYSVGRPGAVCVVALTHMPHSKMNTEGRMATMSMKRHIHASAFSSVTSLVCSDLGQVKRATTLGSKRSLN